MKDEKSEITFSSLKSTILKFVEIINAGDSEKLMEMQADDFKFIDKEGNEFIGKDGWNDYFSSYPDYKIHVKQILTSGNGVAIIGKTTGSHVPSELEKKETVLWLAQVKDAFVAKWHIFSNIDEIRSK